MRDILDKSIDIFILTFDQEVNEEYDKNIYKPLVCGGRSFLKNKNGYLYDDCGDTIFNLNKYYSELSGEYWAWKNTKQDIIGFCHYRRWMVKNLKWEKLSKKDILTDLKEYDIILPNRLYFSKSLWEFHKSINLKHPDYDVLYEDYVKVYKVLEEFFPDYAKYFKKVMQGNYIWTNNMFISKREWAEEYFQWLFEVCDKLMDEIDLTNYESRDTRVFGFIGERLFTTYIIKNNPKFKEYPVLFIERRFPILRVIYSRFPRLVVFENVIAFILNNFKKIHR